MTAGHHLDESQQRIEGPTPGGGAYAIVQYLDSEGRPVAKGSAARAVIHEYSHDGIVVKTTSAIVNGPR